ncbi:MAG: hypothetical protein H0T73_06460 [Ardenticatenales bacterium]|nr:hypothetical protein [Ardenticatenales bacterium]
MRIAILAWGSLIWDQRNLPLANAWSSGGPKLPLEFSRISNTRGGSLTLVIDALNGEPIPVYYASSSRINLDEALSDLQEREGTTRKMIGFVNLLDNTHQSRYLDIIDSIVGWARNNQFDAIIWTDLPSNFQDKAKCEFSVENALAYLQNLSPESQTKARTYIAKAPTIINTPLRRELANKGWLQS